MDCYQLLNRVKDLAIAISGTLITCTLAFLSQIRQYRTAKQLWGLMMTMLI